MSIETIAVQCSCIIAHDVALQEDNKYIVLPFVEVQPDTRFSNDAHHIQKESSNCKTMG